ADLLRAGVLPDDRVVDGLPGVLVPDHGGLTLIRDAHALELVAVDVRPRQGLTDRLVRVLDDLLRVVFDPTGAGKDLLVLELPRGHDLPVMVEYDRPLRGGALVDGEDEFFLTHTDSCVEVVRCDRTQMY